MAQGFLDVSELSFDGIKNNLKIYLKNQAQFQDYDFEGSNLSALLDVLSYNTYMNSYYLNMVGSEAFLDTAQIKSSVVSHAKELNYVPRSTSSARVQVVFNVNTGTDAPNFVIIPAFYTLKTVIDNSTYDFSTSEPVVIYPQNGVYSSDPVTVYEGKIVTEYFTAGIDARYTLQSEYLDTSSIQVYVTQSATNQTTTQFKFAESLVGVTSTDPVFFVQGFKDNQYEIVFGDGTAGLGLEAGNIIKVVYRSSNGAAGNRAGNFSTTTKINNLYNVTVTTVGGAISQGGAVAETIESIRYYAPRHFTTQFRAVTKEDYINLIREKYPQIQTVNVYGGEEANPPQYGKAIISLIPNSTVPFVSDALKADIITYLKTRSLTTDPVIVDPEYMYVEINADVLFDPTLTTKSYQTLQSEINSQIKLYSDNNLTEFGNDLRKSKLASYIDTADVSIVSNQTTLRAIHRITPTKTTSNYIKFSFESALKRPILTPYVVGEQEVIKSSAFSYYNTSSGQIVNAYLSDDGAGKLRIYYIGPLSPVTILESNIGTVDYKTGTLTFNITVQDYINYISIFSIFNTDDIIVNNTKFIKIDYNNVNVNLSVYKP
jgi:hypothetical protein